MLSYFTQLQSITDNQTVAKDFSASPHMDNGKHHKYMCIDCGQSGCFSSSTQSSQVDIDCILWKSRTNTQGLFVGYLGHCLVHPISSHTWEDCFNNPKNKTSEVSTLCQS